MTVCGSCHSDAGESSKSCKRCGVAICKKCSRRQRLVWLIPAIVFFPAIVIYFTASVYCGKVSLISGGVCKEGVKANPGVVDKVATELAMRFLGWFIGVIIVAYLFQM